MQNLVYLTIGLSAGLLSGFLGIGGGAVMVPVMVLFLGMTQHQAQGTTLAVMLPPVFLFAVLRYYKEGHINIPMAAVIAIGLVLGAFIGAHLAQSMPEVNLKRFFGIFLVLVGIKMLF